MHDAPAADPGEYDAEHCRLYRQADELYREGKLQPALHLMKAALALAPGDSDTLWAIAERFLGDGNRYQEIANANGIANPDLINPGQVLNIPG